MILKQYYNDDTKDREFFVFCGSDLLAIVGIHRFGVPCILHTDYFVGLQERCIAPK